MSCIDAAIIKALVEHIGMNPDDVTVGGTSTDTVLVKKGGSIKKVVHPDSINGELSLEFLDVQLVPGDIIKIKDNFTENEMRTRYYLIVAPFTDDGQGVIALSLDWYGQNFKIYNIGDRRITARGNAENYEIDNDSGVYNVKDPLIDGFIKLFATVMALQHPDFVTNYL